MTSHDVLQHLRFQPPKNRELLASAFGKADLILSVSQFNTRQLHRGISLGARIGWPTCPTPRRTCSSSRPPSANAR